MLDEFKNAFQRYNNAHVQLIVINVVIFVVMGILMVVAKASGTQPIFQVVYDQFTLPSQLYEFGRVGILHILMNMLVFYWFAKLFVEYLGSDKLVALYILGGLSGGLLY